MTPRGNKAVKYPYNTLDRTAYVWYSAPAVITTASNPRQPSKPSAEHPPSDLELWPFGNLALSPPLPAPAAFLLESLAQGADPAALAAAHNLSLASLALWIREPHIKHTLDALNDLLTLHRAAWRHQVVKDTVDSLREVMKTSDNLTERRRAAAHIIRALNESTRRQSRGREPADGASVLSRNLSYGNPSPSRGREPAEDASVPPENLAPTNASPHPRPTPAPLTPSSPSPHSVSSSLHLSVSSPPNTTPDLIISALQESTNPTVLDAIRAMVGGPHDEPGSEPAARDLEASLQLLIHALPGASVTSTPAEPDPDGIHATKRYTLTRPDAEPAHFLFRLGYNPAFNDCWLEAITPIDTT